MDLRNNPAKPGESPNPGVLSGAIVRRCCFACLALITGCSPVGIVEDAEAVEDAHAVPGDSDLPGDSDPAGDDVIIDGDPGDDESAPVEISVGRTEAESFSVVGYEVESNSAASAGNLIRLSGGTGSAVGTFTGPAGAYDLTIHFFDENDGNAGYAIEVAGVEVATWRADQNLGDSMPSSTTRSDHRVPGVTLSAGDQIVLRGSADNGERARIDCLDVEIVPEVVEVEYQVFYGSLHNHTSYSDGDGTPAQAYAHARSAGLDFLGIADHTPWPGKSAMDDAEWQATMEQADAANDDGAFVTFRGFEWSSHDTYGHVTVVHTDEYVSADVAPTDSFDELMTWLSNRDGVAFLNHPGADDANHTEFGHFASAPPAQLVGMELFNKTAGFERYYYSDGYFAGDGRGYYDEALSRGWKIGAAGSDDHHRTNWGTSTDFRLAILAPAKTRADLMDALRARRFYSTLDKNLVLEFRVGNSPMGTTVNAGVHIAHIAAEDANDEVFTEIRLFADGDVLHTWQPNTTTPQVSFEVTMPSAGYLYVKVTQDDGDEAISSPIFFE